MKVGLWVAQGYYYAPGGAECAKCGCSVVNVGWQILVYYKKGRGREAEEHVRCYDCYSKEERFFGDAQQEVFFVPDKPPANVHAVPVIPSVPVLVGVRGVGMDVFEGADKLQDCEVEDGTVLAGRPEACLGGVDGVLIGKRPEDVRDPDSDDAIIMLEGSVDRIRDYLRDLLPVDETVVKKLLEDDSS